jgi:multidrug efflux pump subunit AcrA (membrane-fusion protein)
MRNWLVMIFCFMGVAASWGCSKPKVPEAHHEEVPGETILRLSPGKQKTLSLQTAPVKRQYLFRPIFVTGKAIQDPQQMEFIFPSGGGTLSQVNKPVGSWVSKGTIIVEINGSGVRAPRDGTVIGINALPGQKVDPMLPIVTLANIDPVRVVFDVFPRDMDRIRMGQKVEVNLIGHEAEIFPGRVVYLSPNLDDASQSMKVGVDVDNKDGHIKYGMFVHGRILEEMAEIGLVIPEAALARFDREMAVFVMKGAEQFEKRIVTTGIQTEKDVEIRSGLSEGERVVTHGTFQLKSEFLSHLMEEEH